MLLNKYKGGHMSRIEKFFLFVVVFFFLFASILYFRDINEDYTKYMIEKQKNKKCNTICELNNGTPFFQNYVLKYGKVNNNKCECSIYSNGKVQTVQFGLL